MELEARSSGGVDVELTSKVESMYGESIRQCMFDGLKALGVKHAKLTVRDFGALPFTLMARLETAVKRCLPKTVTEFLPELAEACTYATSRERFRRSRLYLPGNNPKFMLNAGIYGADGLILDLEDSVAPAVKDEARLLVRNALRTIDFGGAERMVRINQLPLGLEDLAAIVPHNVHLILIPKVEDPRQVSAVDEHITKLEKQHRVTEPVLLMPILESALGMVRAYEIAVASPRNVALTIGLEDYTADIGTQRTNDGRESFLARSQVVIAARAAGLQPIDTVFSDVQDIEGLRASVLEAKSLGFDGKGCIHPRQIPIIHDAFAPTREELDKAQRIVAAFEEAQAKGLGVVALGSKMIDPPVVKRAQRVVGLAKAMGLLNRQPEGGIG
jgi:citrate lyase subunit beta/citryl-CoA lyase